MARLHRLWQKDFNSFHVFLRQCKRVCVCVCGGGYAILVLVLIALGKDLLAFRSMLFFSLLLRKFGLRFSYVCMMLLSVGWLVGSFVRLGPKSCTNYCYTLRENIKCIFV